jgi:hypothetical protein
MVNFFKSFSIKSDEEDEW